MKKIVLIRIIFGIWTAELFKGCVAPPETGAYNLIYTAFPPHHEQYVYKFNGIRFSIYIPMLVFILKHKCLVLQPT